MTTEAFDKQAAAEIIANHESRPEMLVQILQGFIARFGWITEVAIRQLADELNLSTKLKNSIRRNFGDPVSINELKQILAEKEK